MIFIINRELLRFLGFWNFFGEGSDGDWIRELDGFWRVE